MLSQIITFLVFILILSVLVLVHEFGHFIVSKKLGIKVEEFGLGIPPRIFGKQIGETLYSLNWLPFGGFVKVAGEELEEGQNEEEAIKDPRNFMSKSPAQRIAVLVAGVTMNMILAVTIFYIVLGFSGFRTQYIPMIFDYTFPFGHENSIGTVITAMQKDSGSEKAGAQVGEAISSIDNIKVNNVTDVRNALKGKEGKEVSVELLDMRKDILGPTRVLKMVPTLDAKGNAVVGVYLTKATSIEYNTPIDKTFAGFLHSYNVLDYSIKALGNLISFSVKEKTLEPVSESVSGPVGIYNIVGGLLKYGGSRVVLTILDFVALMSVSLAFMNILPFPALDGGRVLFVLIEKIRGRRVSQSVENMFHRIGFLLLLGMLVVITIKDIIH